MVKGATLFLLYSVIALAILAQPPPPIADPNGDPDASKDFTGICLNHGYHPEPYTATTEDGYHLKLFRIPGPSDQGEQAQTTREMGAKPVVLLQHGILDSATTWIVNSPDKAPAFLLAEAGYDVWLANSRGNYYSRSHKTLDPDKDKEFWDFSWYEMGKYDLPAVITKILKVTGAAKLSYIGHSQGTTQMFSALAENEAWYLERVKVFIGLGPVTNLQNSRSHLMNFLAKAHGVELVTALGVNEMFPRNYLTNKFSSLVCAVVPQVCSFGVLILSDEDTSMDNAERWDVMLAHFPSGSSLKCFAHYAQSIQTKTFRYYDYGKDGNQQHYHQDAPPDVPLENIKKMPIALFVGTADELATTQDSKWTISKLGEGIDGDEDLSKVGHMTFLMAKDMGYFQDVMAELQKHQ